MEAKRFLIYGGLRTKYSLVLRWLLIESVCVMSRLKAAGYGVSLVRMEMGLSRGG